MSAALYAFIGLAALAANLPFMVERALFIWPPKDGKTKAFGWRLLELLVLYVVVGGLGLWLESRLGPVHRQRWQFYVTTFALFVVAAYPGFVLRYFWRKRGM
ncbi:DUF2818 family protein [Chitinimonas sp. BJB300]|uniref:DUF2818 family protein n=1 Tax=Chitinimonas sp. BJB300 TaxID=1559339 RepID=UPI000C0EC0C3|nr:DUF2818 family protein [Chitinimonas sp. BJB300]PHV10803.1 hypothetical protein CSQ89_14370 [Chitinimonas sp. BJB300]TSJ87790.1 DUF2818 family protein [Chitinimonas sp. BJB300]